MGKYKDKDKDPKIDAFIAGLANIVPPSRTGLNIYSKGEDPEIRRENLRFYLEEMKKRNPSRLFVGEAPGRWGCFRTGIPFTDINTLAENDFFKKRRKMNDVSSYIASFEGKKFRKEQSSTVVWECLDELSEFRKEEKLPLFWNICPFHPSDVIDKYVLPEERPNKSPKAREKEKGFEILLNFLKLFPNIDKVYAVGREAEKTLKSEKSEKILKDKTEDKKAETKLEKMFKNSHYIPHPAYQGGGPFRVEFRNIYKIPSKN